MYVVVAAPEQSKQLSVSWAEGAWHGQRGRGMGMALPGEPSQPAAAQCTPRRAASA